MNYAVIRIGGKQYKVSPHDTIIAGRIEGERGEKIEIDEVLLLVDNGQTLIGRPKIEDFSIWATIVDYQKSKKLKVVKFKPKSRYLRVKGTRQILTKLEINSFERKQKKTS